MKNVKHQHRYVSTHLHTCVYNRCIILYSVYDAFKDNNCILSKHYGYCTTKCCAVSVKCKIHWNTGVQLLTTVKQQYVSSMLRYIIHVTDSLDRH